MKLGQQQHPEREITYVTVKQYTVRVCDLAGAVTEFPNAITRLGHNDHVVYIDLQGDGHNWTGNFRCYPFSQIAWFEQIPTTPKADS